MVIQPGKGTRNVNDLFYEVWLCGWDGWTVNSIVSAFRKAKGH